MSDHVTLREIVTNLLYPPRCLLCGTLCGWEELLCESCQRQQPQAGEFFWEPEVFGCRGILWCARYEGAFRAGMEQLKFEGVRESLPLFGGMLTEAVRQSGLLPQLTAVTYVPMPPERERHRGYNQSKLLAQHLAGELGLPLREAKSRIWEAGLNVAGVTLAEDIDRMNLRQARVYLQQPDQGHRVVLGTGISIALSLDSLTVASGVSRSDRYGNRVAAREQALRDSLAAEGYSGDELQEEMDWIIRIENGEATPAERRREEEDAIVRSLEEYGGTVRHDDESEFFE